MNKERIEALIQARGLSKAEFSRLLGIKPQNLSKHLHSCRASSIRKVAEVLGVDIYEIVDAPSIVVQPKKSSIVSVKGILDVDGRVVHVNNLEDLRQLVESFS